MRELVLDIWHGNRGIDLAAWKNKHGLWGVILKAGGSDDPKWGRYEETTLDQQYKLAKSLGLHVGTYYYTNATTVTAARADAEHYLSAIKGYEFDLPCYMDVEEPAQLRLNMTQLTSVVTTFCDIVQNAGYCAGIYSGYDGFMNMHESEYSKYALWVASWRATWPIWAQHYGMWQQGSMRLSDGDIKFDDVSGYVDVNWCQIDYPSLISKGNGKKGGKTVAKKINPAEEAAEIHAFMCTDPRFGYNQQPERWGGDYGETAIFTSKAGYTYKIPCGSYDCSSSTITAWKLALSNTNYAGSLNNATYTGDMRKAFVGSGLFKAEYKAAKRGDLYLNEGVHVAMCQDGGNDGVFGYDCLSEFNRNENHAASYGKPGDQDGYESVIRGYYDDNWNTVLIYVGGLLDDVNSPAEEEQISEGTSPMMMCFVKFDGDQTENFFDGQNFHALKVADEKKAVLDFYQKAFGVTINPNPITIGSKDAPYGARLIDAMLRGPQFATLETFEKHPSVAKVLSDQIRATTAKTDNKAIAEAVKSIL